MEDFDQPSPQEPAVLEREERARTARIEDREISRLAWAYSLSSHEWLKTNETGEGGAVNDEFPSARQFVRPGFDESWR